MTLVRGRGPARLDGPTRVVVGEEQAVEATRLIIACGGHARRLEVGLAAREAVAGLRLGDRAPDWEAMGRPRQSEWERRDA